MPASARVAALLALSHDLGRQDRELAILGEGNASVRRDDAVFLVKASGSNLATLGARQVTACRFDGLLPLLDQESAPPATIDEALLAARERASALKPSVEALFHAWLLTLPGVACVGHTHPIAVNGLLCAGRGRMFAARCLFPDQAVCAGEAAVFVPYVDPGLQLARAIRRATLAFMRRRIGVPRVILLENHGLITLGATPAAVLAATLMTEKAARVFIAASAARGGRAPRFLSAAQVRRIVTRPDEHYRRRMLKI
jgi:rhamnose utilization protein RhaD (predicted bifunctional aldolase and dehydrogenase)